MAKYKNKYRIESNRNQYWHYGNAGIYFITICTDKKQHYFGTIRNGIMCLNDIGTFLHHEWKKTPLVRPDMNLQMEEFVVMPDHFHGLIAVGDNPYNEETNHIHNKQMNVPNNQFGPQRKNIASIVRCIKSMVTTYARKRNPHFAWQANYHDYIVRNEQSFHNFSNYIMKNPTNWGKKKMPKMKKQSY